MTNAARGALLTVTLNPCIDVEARVPVVEPDHKLHCQALRRAPGGGGVNVARVATRLGVPATALVLAGGDNGRLLLSFLAAEGVATEECATAEATRESLTIDEDRTGRQFRFVLPGPTVSAEEGADAARRVEQLAHRHRYVVLSGSMPLGLDAGYLGEMVSRVQRSGAAAVVDTSGPALLHAARAGAALIKPSVNELSGAVGRPLTTEAELDEAARELLSAGAGRAVIISMGASGVLLVESGEPMRRIPAPTVDVVSVIGAGDSLVAGVVVALLRGETMAAAARFGVAAGTATVSRSGSALCLADDVWNFHATNAAGE